MKTPMYIRAVICSILFKSSFVITAQALHINNFELRCSSCVGHLESMPELRAEIMTSVEEKLSAKLGIEEITYADTEKFHEKRHTLLFSALKPKITNSNSDYFANIIFRFVKGSVTSTPKYTIQNVNFKLEVFVVNRKRKKVIKEVITIPARMDAFTPYIHDQKYTAQNLQFLLQTATGNLFEKKKSIPPRITLHAAKSDRLRSFLDTTDSLMLRRKRKDYMIFSEGDEVQRFVIEHGSKNAEFTERFLNLDMSDRIKQKVTMEDKKTGKRYEIVSSVSAQENFNYSLSNDEDDPMVTYYEGERLVVAFTLMNEDLLANWGTDTIRVRELDEDMLEYRINDEKVGLSSQLAVREGGKKNNVTKFHFVKSSSIETIQKLLFSYFAYDLAESMAYAVMEEDD